MQKFKTSIELVNDPTLRRTSLTTLAGSFTDYVVKKKEEEDVSPATPVKLSQRELQFLRMVCTELTYREIAERLYLSPRTIDGYRDDLFFKLNAKTRVGLVMYAIKNGIVTL